MNLSGKDLLKIIFTASLVVVISSLKGKFSEELESLGPLLYFFLFLIVVFTLGLFELLLNFFFDSNLYKKLFLKDTFICGWWINYAYTDEKINNFSLVHIGVFKNKLFIEGMTFHAEKDGAGTFIEEASTFNSRIAQYQPKDRSLGFHFTIIHSDDDSLQGRFGYADYNFVKNDNTYPTSFIGKFSLESLNKFCHVKGHKIQDRKFIKKLTSAIPEDRYKMVYEHAKERGFFDPSHIKSKKA